MKNLSLDLPGGYNIKGPTGVPSGDIGIEGSDVIRLGITVFLSIVVLLSLFYIIWGGIRIVISKGDKQKLEEAREKTIYAIVGLIIAFSAFLIVNLIGFFFGVKLIGR